MNLDGLTFVEFDIPGAMVRTGYATCAGLMALGLIWQTGLARAECVGARPFGDPFRTGCTITDSGLPVLRAAQMAAVAGAGSADLSTSAQPVRFEGTSTRVGVRYICTPSGFGQIANCTPR
jgi:hypothetical protein